MGRKLTQNEWVQKCRNVHGSKYDYSEAKYNGNQEKVKIICSKHGAFFQQAGSHSYGQGCIKCYNDRQKSTKREFISNAKMVHGEKYIYKDVVYKNSYTHVSIICKNHGAFNQKPNYHLMGSGCPVCAKQKVISAVALDTEEFIKRAIKTHGQRYDYSISNYVGADGMIEIICQKHGVFKQVAADHLRGRNCYKCSREAQSEKLTKTTNDFIDQASKLHLSEYDYSLVDYKHCNKNVKIICPTHGEFKQKPINHLRGKGCPKCAESSGERKIRLFLEKKSIEYKYQFLIRNKGKNQWIDFYLPEMNTAIEYNGKQHYMPVKIFGGKSTYSKTVKLDEAKRLYCMENGIDLIEIPYTEFDRINKILNQKLMSV